MGGVDNWEVTVNSLNPGINIIRVWSKDAVGNLSVPDEIMVFYDSLNPDIEITNPNDGNDFETNSSSIALFGTATEGGTDFATFIWSNITTSANGTMDGGVSWSTVSILLNPGWNDLNVSVVSVSGRTAMDSIRIFSDQNLPSVNIIIPTSEDNYTTDFEVVTLKGYANDTLPSSGWGDDFIWSNTTMMSGGTMTGQHDWIAYDIPIQYGENNLKVWAVDAVGNRSLPGEIMVFSDQPNPTITIKNPNNGNDYITTENDVVLSGIAVKGSESSVFDSFVWSNITISAGGIMDGETNWITPSITLENGTNNLQVWAVTSSGLRGTDSMMVFRDDDNPSIIINSPNGGNNFTTSVSQVSLSGTASDPSFSSGWASEFIWSNLTENTGGNMTGGSAWNTLSISLTNGQNNLRVWAIDAAGRQGMDSIVIFMDNQTPEISIQVPTENSGMTTRFSNVTLEGIATDGEESSGWEDEFIWSNITRNAGGTMAGTNNWTCNITLNAGNNLIRVWAIDAVGLQSLPDTISVFRDVYNPDISISLPVNNKTNSTSIALSGTASDDPPSSGLATNFLWRNTSISESGNMPGGTIWETPGINLQEGPNVLRVTAYDKSGRYFSEEKTFWRDTVSPSINIISPHDSTTDVAAVTINGSASDATPSCGWADNFIWSNVTANSGSNFSHQPDGSWNIINAGLVPGANTVLVWAVDGANNYSPPDSLVMFYDGSNPIITITEPNSGNDFTTQLSRSYLFWTNLSNNAGGEIPDANPWTSPELFLDEGENIIQIRVVDNSGRESFDQITIFYDKYNPTISISSPTTENAWTTSVGNIVLGGSASDASPSSGLADNFIWSNLTENTGGNMAGGSSWSSSAIDLIN